MFENKQINGYAYATRFIMSWVRAGGTFSVSGNGYSDFENWLKSLVISNEDVDHILFLARNGKMELESSAKKFMNK